MELTLDALEQLSKECQRKATPHRVLDFKKLRQLADGGGKTPVHSMGMVFLEEHNTGYEGVLYRYLMSIACSKAPLIVQVDLLPGQVEHWAPEQEVLYEAARRNVDRLRARKKK